MKRYCNAEQKRGEALLWRKLDILCKGIRYEGLARDLYSQQNPHITERTGNNGLQIRLCSMIEGVKDIPLNVALTKKFCQKSPYYIYDNGSKGLCLFHETERVFFPISYPEQAPSWYKHPVGKLCASKKQQEKESVTTVVGDLVVLEGEDTAIASITEGCVYINHKKGCRFCAIGEEPQNNSQRSSMLLEAFSIMANDPGIKNIHLTGGNDYTDDRGVSRYIQFVKQIKACRSDVRIAVEFTPPKQKQQGYQKAVFQKIKEAGADSITMNIEFWNDEKRLEFMPEKGAIPKVDYMDAFQTGLEVFGPNKVSCGFIIGLEPLASTLEGIKHVTQQGVIAEVYPFKPNDKSDMENYPITKTAEIMRASLFANECMMAKGIRPDQCSGCVKCGACGITQELCQGIHLIQQ